MQTCDSCQTPLEDEAKFCPECGQKRGELEEESGGLGYNIVRGPAGPERPRPRIFGAVLGALVVWTIILIVLALFLYILATPVSPVGV